MIVDRVAQAIREVGAAEVMTRFNELQAGDISEKSPGDYVTIADQECERVLSERLRTIRNVPVVGEEGATADRSLLDLVDGADEVWVVDPVDGTANFVNGSTDFGVMVALVRSGSTSHAWVWHPARDSMLTATANGTTQCDGRPIEPTEPRSLPLGIVKRKYMPEPAKSAVTDLPASGLQMVAGRRSAAIEYGALVAGELDYIFYWRTLPWDHAPGGLLAQGAGCRVARLDGSEYRPGDGRSGLLAARAEHWHGVADHIRSAFDASS